MQREVLGADLERYYQEEDSIALGTEQCKSCSYCCQHVGRSILLDPYDVFRLTKGLGKSYEALLTEGLLEAHIVEGLLIPNLKMGEAGCGFLNEAGRCAVHGLRPGFCRLFPLARVFHDGGYAYIVQSGQCQKPLTEVLSVREWIGEEAAWYRDFVLSWHDLRKEISERIPTMSLRQQKILIGYLLRKFYEKPYEGEDFFRMYEERVVAAREAMARLLR